MNLGSRFRKLIRHFVGLCALVTLFTLARPAGAGEYWGAPHGLFMVTQNGVTYTIFEHSGHFWGWPHTHPGASQMHQMISLVYNSNGWVESLRVGCGKSAPCKAISLNVPYKGGYITVWIPDLIALL
jgi:hypothetical protein